VKINNLPWLKILFAYILGTVVAYYYKINIFDVWILFPLLLIYIGLNIFYKRYNKSLLNIFTFTIIFLFSFFYTQYFFLHKQSEHFSKHQAKYAIAYIYNAFEERENSFRCKLEVIGTIDSQQHIKNANGKILLYTEKAASIQQYKIGDKVLLPLKYRPIDAPKNINQFNYKNYMALDGIFHQCYLKSFEIKFLHSTNRFLIRRWSYELSIYMQKILKKYIPKAQNFSLADGILLGHRADIDTELYNAFSYIGIIHILSVSGLHVGIIYLLISFLLKFIPNRNNKIRLLKFIIAAILIWVFAFVVGLSPAVVRAAILFSIINFGKIIKEDISNLNILFGAAFLQLLFEPLLIYNIGFQLSYLAMLGLFIFYKPIYALYYSENKMIDWTWQLWSASLAAQVFTFPLAVYYFGNFPSYFLFANIFAIPLSTLILWSSIALLPFSLIPFIAKIIGIFTSYCIDIFIFFTQKISSLPFAKLDYLYINAYQVCLLYFAITCLVLFVFRIKYKYLIYMFFFCIITVLVAYFNQFSRYKNENIILYNTKNNFILSRQQQDNFYLYSSAPISQKEYSFNIHNAFRYFYSRNVIHQDINQNLLQFNEKILYILDKGNINKSFENPLNVDYLIVTDNLYLDVNRIKKNYQFKKIILACNNDYRHINIYKKLLDKASIEYIDLNEKHYIIN
jgi:competence protein ComEC